MRKRSTDQIMRAFWDAKARENATYYVSSYRPYDQQDPDEFWTWGQVLGKRFLQESAIQFSGEESVLEIGCGLGRFTAYFAERFRHVTGLDISSEMIDRARQALDGHDNVDLVVGSGHDLQPLEDGAFDLVFSYIVFQHIPDPAITLRYIEEGGRVLRPGGHFYFQVNNTRTTLRERLKLRTRFAGVLKAMGVGHDARGAVADPDRPPAGPSGLDSPAWQGSRLSVDQIRGACDRGGLEIEHLRGEGTQYLWVRAKRR